MEHEGLSLNSIGGGHVLELILDIVRDRILHPAFGITEYHTLLELALVCHQWKQHLDISLDRTAIVECLDRPNAPARTVVQCLYDMLGCHEFTRNRWVTNSRALLSSKTGNLQDLRLVAKLETGADIWPTDRLLTMQSLQAVKTLRFVGNFWCECDGDQVAEAVARVLPNLTRIDFSQANHTGSALRSVVSALNRQFMPQLHSLCLTEKLVSSGISLASGSLTAVEIDSRLVASDTCTLSALCAQLTSLKIANIGETFSWSIFALPASDQTIFSQLRVLALKFAYCDSLPPKQILPRHHAVSFPVLKRLLVANSHEHSASIYEYFVSSPLEHLVIQECADKHQRLDSQLPLLLRNVHDLAIIIPGTIWKSDTERAEPCIGLLATHSAVRKAHLSGFDFSSSTVVNWPYLQQLSLATRSIALESVGRIVSQLPTLWQLKLEFECLIDSDRQITERYTGVAGQGDSVMSGSLQTIVLAVDGLRRIPRLKEWLEYALCHCPSLVRMHAPRLYVAELQALAAKNNLAVEVSTW